DDLRTDQRGGVCKATTGSEPNRQFIVEWRTTYANRGGNANFEAIFTENSDVIRMRFGVDADHGLSETVGLQDTPTRADQFECNSPDLQNPGQQLTFTPTTTPPPPPPPPPPQPPPPPPRPPPPPPRPRAAPPPPPPRTH